VPQLKRERSLRARFAEANGNYHNISNTWLVRGFPSSSPLTQSGLRRIEFRDTRTMCELLHTGSGRFTSIVARSPSDRWW